MQCLVCVEVPIIGFVWKAMNMMLYSSRGTKVRRVYESQLLIGSRKMSISSSTEIRD